MLPDNIAVNMLGFCCAKIAVVRPAVATPSISNVAAVVNKNTSVLIFVPKVELCNHLEVYNPSTGVKYLNDD